MGLRGDIRAYIRVFTLSRKTPDNEINQGVKGLKGRRGYSKQEKASPQWEMPEKRSYGYAACRWGGSFSPIISASSEGVGMTP
jgi:hypothetical protein